MKFILLGLGIILAFTFQATGQTESGFVELSGTVSDVNGEVIPGAKVILQRKDGAKQQATTSNATGAFRFARVASGSYEIEVQKEAFKSAIIQMNVNARALSPL